MVSPDQPRPRRRWRRWLVRLGLGVALLAVVAVGLFVVLTRNPAPSDFYTPPDDISASPGTILRSERFTTGLPEGARGWRILYASTDRHGDPAAVSGLVIVPRDPPPGPHPVLAWAHGTTGIARACAPSLSEKPLEGIPDMSGPLARGWLVVLTDYPGLGTPSPHPYLVGASEGRAVLDSVLAAHELDTGHELSDDYLVWGHSQGGHAALFAGQLAEDHLPDHDLVGVAALAPATRLRENFDHLVGTEAGNVLTALAVEAWSDYYPGVTTDVLVRRARRPAARIAEACLNQPSRFRIVVAGLALPHTITSGDITDDPTWAPRLEENTPEPAGVDAPLFVAQGLADEIIAPDVTRTWVADRCAARSTTTEWRTYPGLDHVGVVGPGGADALAWSVARIEGTPAESRCPRG